MTPANDPGVNQDFKDSFKNNTKLFAEDQEFIPSFRKISNEIDFDNELFNRVDMLLNQNV